MSKTSPDDKALIPGSAEELAHILEYSKADDRINFCALSKAELNKTLFGVIRIVAMTIYAVKAEAYDTPIKLMSSLIAAGADPQCILTHQKARQVLEEHKEWGAQILDLLQSNNQEDMVPLGDTLEIRSVTAEC